VNLRRRSLPIRARLALYYAAVLAVILAALGVYLVVALRGALEDRAHDSLEAAYEPVAAQLAQASGAPDLAAYLHAGAIPGEDDLEVVGQILDRSGRVVEASGAPGTTRPMVDVGVLAEATRRGHWHEPRRIAGRPHEDLVIVVPLATGPRAGSFAVFAQSLRATDDAVRRLIVLLLLASPLALGLAVAGGWRVARAALGPVDDLTRTAAEIDAARSGARLPEPERADELGRLARTLNAMLTRLDEGLTRERRFAADASHELRTPLGLMATELDVALRAATATDDPRPLLRSVRGEVTRLSRLVDDLLVLSRADALEGVALARQQTDLLDLAITVVARMQPLAQAREIALALDGEPVHADVDPVLLGQALSNLVDNAIKHSPQATPVAVHVGPGPVLSVTDSGPGIPAEDLAHVFDRFYRVDRARGRETGGAGLGLAIARAVAQAHGGSVEAISRPGEGSTFTIRLSTPPGSTAAAAREQ